MKALQKLLDKEREKLIAATLKADGAVEKEDFDRLERLSKVSAGAGRERRGLVLGLVGALVLATTLALTYGPNSTDIDLEVSATEFSFSLPEAQPILNQNQVSSLASDGLTRIELASGETITAPDERSACYLHLELPPTPAGGTAPPPLTVTPFTPPAGTRLRLTRLPTGLRWLVDSGKTLPPEPLQFSFDGAANASFTCGLRQERRTLAGPAIVRAYTLSRFGLTVHTAQPVFPREISIAELALFQQEDRGGGAMPRLLSGLLGGTVHFNDLNGKALSLRPAETLEFQKSHGEIRTITAKPGEESFGLQAHLTVEGLSSGSGLPRRSRMPNWMEWLYAQEWLARYGALVPLVLSLYSLLKWFKWVS